jgi:hypothetical protein
MFIQNFRLHILFWFSLLLSISGECQFKKAGVITIDSRIFNSRTNNYESVLHIEPHFFLYKDSMIIEEVHYAHFKSKNDTATDWESKVLCYYFIDLRNMIVYKYHSFSPDSMFTKKYTKQDSFPFRYGWNFYNHIAYTNQKNIQKISDTMLSNINYKRAIATYTSVTDKGDSLLCLNTEYLRCDKRGSFFNLNEAIGVILNLDCPVVMSESYYPNLNFRQKDVIEFLPRKLTKEEKKVFKAWEKNEKLYPIK